MVLLLSADQEVCAEDTKEAATNVPVVDLDLDWTDTALLKQTVIVSFRTERSR